MISAKEANRKTIKEIERYDNTELLQIEGFIEDAIIDGLFSFTREGVLSKNTIDLLKLLGYKVITGSQYNESYYTISWKDV